LYCGFGILPWSGQRYVTDHLTLTNPEVFPFLPRDSRLDFLRLRIGFTDLKDYRWNKTTLRFFMTPSCRFRFDNSHGFVSTVAWLLRMGIIQVSEQFNLSLFPKFAVWSRAQYSQVLERVWVMKSPI
jgi:hypothetical protein